MGLLEIIGKILDICEEFTFIKVACSLPATLVKLNLVTSIYLQGFA